MLQLQKDYSLKAQLTALFSNTFLKNYLDYTLFFRYNAIVQLVDYNIV